LRIRAPSPIPVQPGDGTGRPGKALSHFLALRRHEVALGVFAQQRALRHGFIRRFLHALRIGSLAAVALFERGAWIVPRLALGAGRGKWGIGPVAVAQFALLIPARFALSVLCSVLARIILLRISVFGSLSAPQVRHAARCPGRLLHLSRAKIQVTETPFVRHHWSSSLPRHHYLVTIIRHSYREVAR
jgi:hypothetical protein